MRNKPGHRWDIFCRIVDNLGDIGVCWRLSQQLAHEHHLQIRLFIDDLGIAQKIIPTLNASIPSQSINGVEICAWPDANNAVKPADVALETFSCELPTAYLAEMQADTAWVNLEYLSAEPWVADFHAKPSPQANGLTRYFYFPGFTSETGGLIREADIFQLNPDSHLDCRSGFSPSYRVAPRDTASYKTRLTTLNLSHEDGLKISLFCYPHAPIHGLLNAMADSNQRIHCYVPSSSILPKIAHYFGKDSIDAGEKLIRKNLKLHILPFSSQSDYDKLLATCDINFVRGEDSWIRAIWAGKPFIWQPYLQTENTHITKLNAFLNLFYIDCDEVAKKTVYELHTAWLKGAITTQIWQNYLDNLHTIKPFTLRQANQLAEQSDLASKLVIFLQKL